MGQSFGKRKGNEPPTVEGANVFANWTVADVRRAYERCRAVLDGEEEEAIFGFGPTTVGGQDAHHADTRDPSLQRKLSMLSRQGSTRSLLPESAKGPVFLHHRKRSTLTSIPDVATQPATETPSSGSHHQRSDRVSCISSNTQARGASVAADGMPSEEAKDASIAGESKAGDRWSVVRKLVKDGTAIDPDAERRLAKKKVEKARERGQVLLHHVPKFARVVLEVEAQLLEEQRIAAEEEQLAKLCEAFMYLSRRDFWMCFSDYTKLRGATAEGAAPTFLSLPMSVFNVFAQGKPMANATQVLLMLALFCRGTRPQQLNLAFDIFDFDKSGGLDLNEMIAFLLCLVNGAYKIGLVERRPPFRQMLHVATSMFEDADKDSDQSVSKAEFVRWAMNHVASKSLVKTFRFVADMERKVSAQAARAAKQGNVDRALKLAESKSGAGMQDILRKQRFAKLRRQRERLTSGHRQLVSETRFTMHELRRIQQEFMRRANGGATLQMAGFVSIMTAEWPSLKPEALESMFHAFDTDNSMDIDYVELVLGLSKLADGAPEDRIKLLFDVFDADGSGSLEGNELLAFLKQETQDFVHASQFVREVLTEVHTKAVEAGVAVDDEEVGRRITKEEFVNVLLKEPMLFDCFSKSIISEDRGKNPRLRHLFQTAGGARAKAFDLAFLGKIWEKCRRSADEDIAHGHEEWEMTREQFHDFMRENFGTSKQALVEVDKLFDELDTNKEGSIGMKELFTSLGQLASGSAEQQAAFYFRLFQSDEGTVDMDFVLGRVEQMSGETAAATQVLEATVAQLKEQSEDGKLNLTEFQTHVKDKPELLHLFHRVMGTHTLSAAGSHADVNSDAAQQGLYNQRESNEYASITKLLKRSATVRANGTLIPADEPGAIVKTMKLEAQADNAEGQGLGRFRRLSLSTQHRFLETMQQDAQVVERQRELKRTMTGMGTASFLTLGTKTSPPRERGMKASASCPVIVSSKANRPFGSQTHSRLSGATRPQVTSGTKATPVTAPAVASDGVDDADDDSDDGSHKPWFERLSQRKSNANTSSTELARVLSRVPGGSQSLRRILPEKRFVPKVPKYKPNAATLAAQDHARQLRDHIYSRKREVTQTLVATRGIDRKFTTPRPSTSSATSRPRRKGLARAPSSPGMKRGRKSHPAREASTKPPVSDRPHTASHSLRSSESAPSLLPRKRGHRSKLGSPLLLNLSKTPPGRRGGGKPSRRSPSPGPSPKPSPKSSPKSFTHDWQFAGDGDLSGMPTLTEDAPLEDGGARRVPNTSKRSNSSVSTDTESVRSVPPSPSSQGRLPGMRSFRPGPKGPGNSNGRSRRRRIPRPRLGSTVSLVLERDTQRISRQLWLDDHGSGVAGIDLPPGLDVDGSDSDEEDEEIGSQRPITHSRSRSSNEPADQPERRPASQQARIARALRHTTPRVPTDEVFGLPYGIPLTIDDIMKTETRRRW